ncbi:MAG: class II glutamine amidotransferase [Sulfuritalea sp.]|nr:class II glutamine amidotransferase [Sulfuritalea sp.]
MNCNTPTDICFSFEGFRTRGGLTDIHRDGWGIAFFEGLGCRVFLDVEPSAQSAVAELVHSYPIRSKNVIAHIRKATQGKITLENTHPFQRELWGRYWIFAHNGNLKEFLPTMDGSYTPVGDTDSERAFCYILQKLRQRFPTGMPPQEMLLAALVNLAGQISRYGEFNFLLSSGDCLLTHCSSKLCYIVRKAPFAVAHLRDQDVSVDFSEATNPDDRVAVIATLPLTDNEAWTTFAPGTLTLFHDGMPVRSALTNT